MKEMYSFKILSEIQLENFGVLLNNLADSEMKFSVTEKFLMDFRTSKPSLLEGAPDEVAEYLAGLKTFEVREKFKDYYHYACKLIELEVDYTDVNDELKGIVDSFTRSFIEEFLKEDKINVKAVKSDSTVDTMVVDEFAERFDVTSVRRPMIND